MAAGDLEERLPQRQVKRKGGGGERKGEQVEDRAWHGHTVAWLQHVTERCVAGCQGVGKLRLKGRNKVIPNSSPLCRRNYFQVSISSHLSFLCLSLLHPSPYIIAPFIPLKPGIWGNRNIKFLRFMGMAPEKLLWEAFIPVSSVKNLTLFCIQQPGADLHSPESSSRLGCMGLP